MIFTVLYKIASVFLLIAVGYLSVNTGLLSFDHIPALNKLLFNVVSPLMLVYSLSSRTFEPERAYDTASSILSYMIILLILLLLMYCISCFRGFGISDRGVVAGAMTFTNIGYLGIPLSGLLFNDEIEMNIIIMNISFNLVFFTIGTALIFREKGQTLISSDMIKKLFNMPLIGATIGMVMYLTNIDLPALLGASFSAVGDMMTPLSMIIVGMQLARSNILKIISLRNIAMCIVKLMVAPAITLGIVLLLPISASVALTLVFISSLPTASLIMITAQEYGRETGHISEIIVLTTFFCIFTLPIWTMILTYIFM